MRACCPQGYHSYIDLHGHCPLLSDNIYCYITKHDQISYCGRSSRVCPLLPVRCRLVAAYSLCCRNPGCHGDSEPWQAFWPKSSLWAAFRSVTQSLASTQTPLVLFWAVLRMQKWDVWFYLSHISFQSQGLRSLTQPCTDVSSTARDRCSYRYGACCFLLRLSFIFCPLSWISILKIIASMSSSHISHCETHSGWFIVGM